MTTLEYNRVQDAKRLRRQWEYVVYVLIAVMIAASFVLLYKVWEGILAWA